VLPGISFIPNFTMSYTVTYTATDTSNNSTSFIYYIKPILSTQRPTIKGLTDGTVSEIELGQTVDLGNVTAVDTDGTPLTVQRTCSSDLDWSFVGNIFAPAQQGTYTISYTATNANGTTTATQTVTVDDNNAPVLTLLPGLNGVSSIVSKQVQFPDAINASSFTPLHIPDVTAAKTYNTTFFNPQKGDELWCTTAVTITGPQGNYSVGNNDPNLAISYDTDTWDYVFTPNAMGTYTVTYTASDGNGQTATQTITITCGDVTPPVLTFTNTLPSTFKIGDQFSFNVGTDVTIYDGVDDNPTITPSMMPASGASLTPVITDDGQGNSVYTYTFTTAGTYTFAVQGRDSANNVSSLTQQMTVAAAPTSSGISNQVVGIVLIIVSLLILAGVVAYFIWGGKGKKGTPSKFGKSGKTAGKEPAKEAPKAENE